MMAFRLWITIPLLGVMAIPYLPKRTNGIAIFIDERFQATVVASNDDGITAPDGVAWHGRRIYLADEGASAVVTLECVDASSPSILGLPDRESPPIASKESTVTMHQRTPKIAGIQSPEDLVVDSDGTIFFTDDDAGGVWQVTPSGVVSQLASKKDGLLSTEGLVIAPNNNLLVGDGQSHSIFEVTRQGVVSLFLGPEAGITKPESLVFDPNGILYIADNQQNVVYRLDQDHRLERLITSRDGLVQPESMCFCGAGLYITDDESGRLYRYTPQDGLRVVAVFAGRLKYVQGIAPGPDGSLLVTVQDLKHLRGLVLKISQVAERTTTRSD